MSKEIGTIVNIEDLIEDLKAQGIQVLAWKADKFGTKVILTENGAIEVFDTPKPAPTRITPEELVEILEQFMTELPPFGVPAIKIDTRGFAARLNEFFSAAAPAPITAAEVAGLYGISQALIETTNMETPDGYRTYIEVPKEKA